MTASDDPSVAIGTRRPDLALVNYGNWPTLAREEVGRANANRSPADNKRVDSFCHAATVLPPAYF